VSMRISAAVVFIGHSTGQRHPAERINEHHNYQDEPDDTDASAASPSRISVIATASAEQEHCENNQQQHGIVLSGYVGPNPICGQAQTKTVPICTRRFWKPQMSTTMRLEIVTTSKEETNRSETNR
jgi:hypothetical protein